SDRKLSSPGFPDMLRRARGRIKDRSGLAQLADPHVPVTHRIPVVLQPEGKLFRMPLVGRTGLVRGGTGQRLVVLDQHAVVENGGAGGPRQRAVAAEARPVEHDDGGLPLAWSP